MDAVNQAVHGHSHLSKGIRSKEGIRMCIQERNKTQAIIGEKRNVEMTHRRDMKEATDIKHRNGRKI